MRIAFGPRALGTTLRTRWVSLVTSPLVRSSPVPPPPLTVRRQRAQPPPRPLPAGALASLRPPGLRRTEGAPHYLSHCRVMTVPSVCCPPRALGTVPGPPVEALSSGSPLLPRPLAAQGPPSHSLQQGPFLSESQGAPKALFRYWE